MRGEPCYGGMELRTVMDWYVPESGIADVVCGEDAAHVGTLHL